MTVKTQLCLCNIQGVYTNVIESLLYMRTVEREVSLEKFRKDGFIIIIIIIIRIN